MMSNLRGRRFGRLTVLRDSGKRTKNRGIIWICLCICGSFTEVVSNKLLQKHTQSCGCKQKETQFQSGYGYKHGEAKNRTRLYNIWADMACRCRDFNTPYYKYYGERGIKVCKEWKDDYITFKKWALANGYKNHLTIDRIDNDGNYEPDNCQWITNAENIRKSQKIRWKKYDRNQKINIVLQ